MLQTYFLNAQKTHDECYEPHKEYNQIRLPQIVTIITKKWKKEKKRQAPHQKKHTERQKKKKCGKTPLKIQAFRVYDQQTYIRTQTYRHYTHFCWDYAFSSLLSHFSEAYHMNLLFFFLFFCQPCLVQCAYFFSLGSCSSFIFRGAISMYTYACCTLA